MKDPFAGLGIRVELVSTDKYFRDISIALYAQLNENGWNFLVRSFATYDGVRSRIDFIIGAMQILGGMQSTGEHRLRFPCGNQHLVAVRRLFLRACKEVPGEAIQKIPLVLWDKKSEMTITATPKGAGTYLLVTDGDSGRRLMALRNAMNKLADLEVDESISEQFCFSCGHDHHDLVGMLLQSAPNVRAVMREFEMNAAKGVLLAPGSQN